MLSYGDTAIVGSVPIRFILTYPTSDFTVDDVVAIGGEVSNFHEEDSLIYTATFNSVVAASDTRSIHIPTHAFTDAHGESNHESNLFQWNYDNSRPTITITAEDRIILGTPITSGSRTCDLNDTKFDGHKLVTGSHQYIETPTSAEHCAKMCAKAVNAINADRLTNGETALTPWTTISTGERAMSYVVFERFDIRVLN